jgi:hypothetical protein
MDEVKQIRADADLKKLVDQIKNFETNATEIIIDSDEKKETGISIMSDVKKSLKTLETKRVDYKKAYLDKCKDIDAFAKTFSEPLNAVFKTVNDKLIDYHTEQKRLQDEADRKAREKFEKEQLAKELKLKELQEKLNSGKIGDLDRRIIDTDKISYFTKIDDVEYEIISGLLSDDSSIMPQAKDKYQAMINKAKKDELKTEQKIEKVEETVIPLPIPESAPVENKTTTEKASMSIGTEWVFKITDVNKVPREYMIVDEKKIKALVKAGSRKIDGVLIYEQPKSNFRVKK